MTEETKKDAPEENEDNGATEESQKHAAGIGSALARALIGREPPRTVSTTSLPQLTDFVGNYIKPDILDAVEPETGVSAPVVVSNGGVQPLSESLFDQYRLAPKRRAGRAEMLDLTSFIAHANRFKDDHSVIFADNRPGSASLRAVLNYHIAGADSAPRFGDHTTSFSFPLSDEWKAWAELNGSQMEAGTFARFLEDHIVDVMPVDNVQFSENEDEARNFVDLLGGRGKLAEPAKLMQIASGLQVLEASHVKQAQSLATGEVKIDFETTHETQDTAGQSMTVPSLFAIGIPVFANGPAYRILARLRYRKQGAKVIFYYELWRADRVFDHAFDEASELAGAETGLPVLLGSPE